MIYPHEIAQSTEITLNEVMVTSLNPSPPFVWIYIYIYTHT